MELKIIKTSSVKSVKKQFQKEFDCNIRIYKGNKFADDDLKISELTSSEDFTDSIKLGARSRVKNVEEYFKNKFGIKVQISNADDTKLADNDLTLAQAGKL